MTVFFYTTKMKWEDIYCKSKLAVDKATSSLLGETGVVHEDEQLESIVDKLLDTEYMEGCLEERKRFNGKKAFLQMKRHGMWKKWIRIGVWASSAACVAIVCVLLLTFEKEPISSFEIANSEIQSVETKALLIRSDGQKVALGKGRQYLHEDGVVVVTADSVGLKYSSVDENTYDSLAVNRIEVPRGGMYMLKLSDGTHVWMNSDSWIEFPVVFSKKYREVKLGGEAYFDVAKNGSSPFVVKTLLGEVKVLGTEFNVKCYPEDALVATTLVEGRVSFANKNMQTVTLHPGEQATWGKEYSRTVVQKVNVDNFISWKENRLSFQRESLEKIMLILSRWYDIGFVFENERLKKLEFSGNLDKYTDIYTFLRLFEMGSNVHFEVQGKTVFIREKIFR